MCNEVVLTIGMTGEVWIHELFHVDWVSQALPYGSSFHVTDIKIKVRLGTGPSPWVKVYGPGPVKTLARWGIITGSWVIKNADGLNL
jgi:hypothetical protein